VFGAQQVPRLLRNINALIVHHDRQYQYVHRPSQPYLHSIIGNINIWIVLHAIRDTRKFSVAIAIYA
jgi:hypothetical protein